MKLLLMSLLLSIGMVAMNHQSVASNLKTRISDDAKTLSIQIDGSNNGRSIHYHQTFDVAGMNALQKEVIKYRAFDSVGIMVPLHEIQGLLLLVFGLPALIIALLIVRFQSRKSTSMKPVSL